MVSCAAGLLPWKWQLPAVSAQAWGAAKPADKVITIEAKNGGAQTELFMIVFCQTSVETDGYLSVLRLASVAFCTSMMLWAAASRGRANKS